MIAVQAFCFSNIDERIKLKIAHVFKNNSLATQCRNVIINGLYVKLARVTISV